MNNFIEIDRQACIGCGMCARECIDNSLVLRDGQITLDPEGRCIECGHCIAICPAKAVHLSADAQRRGHREEDIVEYDQESFQISPENLLNAIKFRRSVRYYLPQDVEEEKILKVLEAGRYSPTGANLQGISCVVLRERRIEVQRIIMDKFRLFAKIGSFIERFVKLPIKCKRFIDKPDEFLLRGAPVVIVVTSKNPIDASLATANMELMAEAQGLGVLHNGFFAIFANMSSHAKRILGLTRKQKITNVICLGYPAVRFHRTVTRNPLKVNWT